MEELLQVLCDCRRDAPLYCITMEELLQVLCDCRRDAPLYCARYCINVQHWCTVLWDCGGVPSCTVTMERCYTLLWPEEIFYCILWLEELDTVLCEDWRDVSLYFVTIEKIWQWKKYSLYCVGDMLHCINMKELFHCTVTVDGTLYCIIWPLVTHSSAVWLWSKCVTVLFTVLYAHRGQILYKHGRDVSLYCVTGRKVDYFVIMEEIWQGFHISWKSESVPGKLE